MKYFITAIGFIFTGICAWAQDAEFTAKQYTSPANEILQYRELLPENFNKAEKYPLVIFLHGSGERGFDNKAQLLNGGRMFTNPVNREKYPAIVIFPQCPPGLVWAFDLKSDEDFDPSGFPPGVTIPNVMQNLKGIIDQYIASGNVDTNRIYIMGLSMGGSGTYTMVIEYPDLFAAAVPICGELKQPALLKTVAPKVPFRIFHGDHDDAVPVFNSRNAYLALKQYGGDPKYTEFVGCNHNSWDPAFNQPDFLSWLFAQKKH